MARKSKGKGYILYYVILFFVILLLCLIYYFTRGSNGLNGLKLRNMKNCDCLVPGPSNGFSGQCCDPTLCDDSSTWGVSYNNYCVSNSDISDCQSGQCNCISDCQSACQGDQQCEISCFQQICVGNTGSSGVSSGPMGPSGPSGYSGNSGHMGRHSSGPSGPSGPMGGYSGPMGPMGPSEYPEEPVGPDVIVPYGGTSDCSYNDPNDPYAIFRPCELKS